MMKIYGSYGDYGKPSNEAELARKLKEAKLTVVTEGDIDV